MAATRAGRALVVAALHKAGGGPDRRRASRGRGDGCPLTGLTMGALASTACLLRNQPTRQVITGDGPHPPVELVAIAATRAPASFFSAVPPTCPKHRVTAVIHGQPRSMPTPVGL